MDSPPTHIWEEPQDRFDPSNFSVVTINMYRLAALYSIKVINEDFLISPTPPTEQSDLSVTQLSAVPMTIGQEEQT